MKNQEKKENKEEMEERKKVKGRKGEEKWENEGKNQNKTKKRKFCLDSNTLNWFLYTVLIIILQQRPQGCLHQAAEVLRGLKKNKMFQTFSDRLGAMITSSLCCSFSCCRTSLSWVMVAISRLASLVLKGRFKKLKIKCFKKWGVKKKPTCR